jgi:hypothetical protein
MYSKSQFYDLELMCQERAAAARKQMEYWLAEAEEWMRLRRRSNLQQKSSSTNPVHQGVLTPAGPGGI